MSIIFFDPEAEYIPKTTDQKIRAKVKIGDGQSGGYVIFLGRQESVIIQCSRILTGFPII